MKSLKFWKMQIQDLSPSERMFYKDVIDTLMSWSVLKEECLELIILQRMLESEIHISGRNDREKQKQADSGVSLLCCPLRNVSNYKKYPVGSRTF